MNTQKTFLLSYDVFLFSGIKALLPNLVLVDANSFISEGQQFLPQYKSCFLIIDNRLPLLLVNKWLQRNSTQFIQTRTMVIRLSPGMCFNHGYENFDSIDANSSTDELLNRLKKYIFSLADKKEVINTGTITSFHLTKFEKDMLNASFDNKQLDKFCDANNLSMKSLYRCRDKIKSRLGFDNFNASLIFLIRNNLLSASSCLIKQEEGSGHDLSRVDYLGIAIMNDEVVPYYQPIANSHGEICGVEILPRWPEGHHYDISQKELIPLAENSGLINELTTNLMASVARDLKKMKNFTSEIFISFNIGSSGLNNPVFYWECLNFIKSTNNSSLQLMIEISEHQSITITPAIKEMVRSLRKRGVLFALNDFGTGYANLYHLNELELDIIKIDKIFIHNVSEEEQHVPMLDSIIHLANTLGLKTIAKGVKYEYQQQWIINNKIDYLQGDFLLPPVSFDDFIYFQNHEHKAPKNTTEYNKSINNT